MIYMEISKGHYSETHNHSHETDCKNDLLKESFTDCTRSWWGHSQLLYIQSHLSAEWIITSHVCHQGLEVTHTLLLLLGSSTVQAVTAVSAAGLYKNHLRNIRCGPWILCCIPVSSLLSADDGLLLHCQQLFVSHVQALHKNTLRRYRHIKWHVETRPIIWLNSSVHVIPIPQVTLLSVTCVIVFFH